MTNRNLAEKLLPIATINRTSAQLIKSSVHANARTLAVIQLDTIASMLCSQRWFSASATGTEASPCPTAAPEPYPRRNYTGKSDREPGSRCRRNSERRAKGMGGGEDLVGDELITAQLDWIEYALDCTDAAERAMKRDEEKETVNRRLDMVIYMHSLQSATRDVWMNFHGLRLANASPTIEVLAARTFEIYKAAEPNQLSPGCWHLPFVDQLLEVGKTDILINLSAARIAHLSYNDLETGQRMTIERALGIAVKLKDSKPLHASPFEHQATPDNWYKTLKNLPGMWECPHQHGNLHGWRQARKMIPGEAVASLPEGWEL